MLVPEPNHVEVKIAIVKFKTYELSGSDKFPEELTQAGGLRPILSLILLRIRKIA
jgi:hypothetical protein